MSSQQQVVRVLSRLRMGSTLAHVPESLPGTKAASCIASGRSVAPSAGLRAVLGGNDMDRGCLPGGWRGKARLSTSGLSRSITATTTTPTPERTGAAVNVLSTDMPASAMQSEANGASAGSAEEMTAPLRLPVYSFVDDGAGKRDGNGNGAASSSTSAVDVPADIFAQPLRPDILHRVVRWQLARRQQGTHKTKTRSEVRGGGRKPWQQKGSGRARQGTIRAVQWRGGGTVHGPVVRSHAHDLPKKVRRLGLAVAVSAKLEEGRLVIVDRFAGEGEGDAGEAVDNKTQAMLRRIDGLFARAEVPVTRRSVLMVDGADGIPASVVKSTRNIPWVDVIPVVGLNVYSILQRDVLVMTKDAVEGLVTRLHTPIRR